MGASSGTDRFEVTKADNNGNTWNGLTDYSATSNSNLDLNIYMYTYGATDNGVLTEIFAHESLVHGDKYSLNLKLLQNVGQANFIKIISANNDHKALRDGDLTHSGYRKYNSAMQKLTEMKPNKYGSIMLNAKEDYKIKYKKIK